MKRCAWVGDDDDYIRYHDEEWGVPVHDDKTHFEFLILEGAQAGLSWLTILKRRDGYRRVYDGFDPEKVAAFDGSKQAEMLQLSSSGLGARLGCCLTYDPPVRS